MGTAKHTPGPWHLPHFVDDDTKCDCTAIVDEGYAGGICDIHIGNGLPVSEGGNDAPPLEEARANARLIAAAPETAAERDRLKAEVTELVDGLSAALGTIQFMSGSVDFSPGGVAATGWKNTQGQLRALEQLLAKHRPKTERCPTCGDKLLSIFDHVDREGDCSEAPPKGGAA